MSDLVKLEELQEQIRKLQEQEKTLISEAREGVIKEMRDKIARFKLTAADLGLTASAAVAPVVKKSRAKAISEVVSLGTYKSPDGQVWIKKSGPGRPPKWVVDLRATGVDIETLREKTE